LVCTLGDCSINPRYHAVYKFTREGDKLLTIGIPGQPGDDDRHLKMPTDVIESPSGDIFLICYCPA
jgi:hypothetical protein